MSIRQSYALLSASLLGAGLLVSCQQPTDDSGVTAPADVPAANGSPMVQAPTMAAPPAEHAPAAARNLEPTAMALSDWRGAKLRGELGCGFRREGGEGPLLFAASDVDPAATADAAIKLDGRVIKLTTQSRGGFDAMSKGARFVGPNGLFANVVRGTQRRQETPRIAEESPLYPGQLVISQDGRELAIDGLWECGP